MSCSATLGFDQEAQNQQLFRSKLAIATDCNQLVVLLGSRCLCSSMLLHLPSDSANILASRQESPSRARNDRCGLLGRTVVAESAKIGLLLSSVKLLRALCGLYSVEPQRGRLGLLRR